MDRSTNKMQPNKNKFLPWYYISNTYEYLYSAIKADRPLMRDTLNVPITNKQIISMDGNGQLQSPLA